MSRAGSCWAAAAALFFSLAGNASGAVEPATVERIDKHITSGLDSNGVPGAALGIVDGDRVYRRGLGDTGNGEKVTPQTPFIICSVAKSFTALATMQLVERGRIDLDAPVRRYLPWFKVGPARDTDKVTVRMLLNQTSGISTQAGGPGLRYLANRSVLETAKELIDTNLVHAPGSEFEYANGNFALLGALIEAAAGQSFTTYMKTEVLDPLGMRHTYLSLPPAQRDGLAAGHRYWFGWTAAHTSFTEGLVPVGGVISTASDMTLYMRMLLNRGELAGRRLLSARGVAALFAPAAAATVGLWAKQQDVSYAMGWYVGGEPFGPKPAIFHPGGSPDFGSMLVLLPRERAGLVLLYNATPEIELPGAAGALDRIPAGAVSILMGVEPAEGTTMHEFYVWFDAFTIVVVALLLFSLYRALRHGRRPRTRARTRLAVAVDGLSVVFGLLLLAFPTLIGVGWQVLFLSDPDFTLVLAAVGGLLVLVGAVRIVMVLRPRVAG